MLRGRISRWGLAGLAAGTATLSLVIPAQASLAGSARPALPQTVKGPPPTSTPHFPATTKTVEQIRKLADCGGTMYAVGAFTTVLQSGKTYTRNNAFSFRDKKPFTMTSWNPNVNGTVSAITFVNGNCNDAYIGGRFTKVGSASATNLAEVSTSGTGALVSAFGHTANGQITTLAGYQGHLITGGYFTVINGSHNPYLASLRTTGPGTLGGDDGLIQLHISGNYVFPGVTPNVTRVGNQQLSHSGRLDLVEGDFTSVGGAGRRQAFVLNLASRPHATVTSWTNPRFDGSRGYPRKGFYYNCTAKEPEYIRSGAWSPDDQTIYLASTGYRPWNYKTGFPLRGLCDAASAFSATDGSLRWINYDGCYTLLSAAADANTAYFGGHELWSQAPNGCKNTVAPHAISAPGFEGLDPKTGNLVFNPTRSRGIGADDLIITGPPTGTGTGGLWIANDNFGGSQYCDHQGGLAGLCFLPY